MYTHKTAIKNLCNKNYLIFESTFIFVQRVVMEKKVR